LVGQSYTVGEAPESLPFFSKDRVSLTHGGEGSEQPFISNQVAHGWSFSAQRQKQIISSRGASGVEVLAENFFVAAGKESAQEHQSKSGMSYGGPHGLTAATLYEESYRPP
jgi:hypothetical protein